MKAIIKSPVKDYMGISASVAFADGKAEADISESQLEYFESADYEVKILEADKAKGKGKKPVEKPEADKAEEKEAEADGEAK